MRWLRIGFYLCAGLITILLLLGVVLVSIDLGRFKSQTETLVTNLLGRELRIEGELLASIGKNIEVYGENIFLANPKWADNPTFVSASKLHIIVETSSLLNGPIAFTLVEIDGLRVNIEQNEAGEASWNFPALKSKPDQKAEEKTTSNNLLPIVIGSIAVNDSVVSYKSSTMAEPHLLMTETLLSFLDTEQLSLEHRGFFNGTELYFKQTVSPVENLLAMKNLNVEFNGNVGEITLKGTSKIDDLSALRRPHLELNIEGPSATYLTELFSLQAVTSGPLNLTLSIMEEGEQMIPSLHGVFGEFNVDIEGSFQNLEDFEGFTLNIDAEGPNIASVAGLAGLNGLPAEKFEVTASIEKEPSGFLIQNFQFLVDDEVVVINGHIGNEFIAGESDFEFDVQGSNLGSSVLVLGNNIEQLPEGAFSLTGKIRKKDDRLILTDIEAALGDNNEYQIQTSGFLTLNQDFVDSEISLHAQASSLAILTELTGQEGIPDFPFEVSANIRRGDSNTNFETGLLNYGALALEFSGELGDKLLEDDFSLNFNTSISNLRELLSGFGIAADMLPEQELKASVSLQQSAGTMSVEEFEMSIADARLQASGDIGLISSLAGSHIEFELEGSDLSSLLPERFTRESLAHPFAASGTLILDEGELNLEQLKANIAHTTFGGDLTLNRAPFLSSGSFKLIADSPNILHLVSQIEGFSAFSEETLKFRGSGHWEENYWSFDDTRLDLDEGYLKIQGTLDGLPTFERTNLDIEWIAPSMSKLSALAGRELPDLPLRLTAHLDGTRDMLTMHDFDLSLGDNDLQGELTLRAGDIPSVELDLRSRLIDLTELLPADSKEDVESISDDKRLIPDIKLDQPLQFLQAFNAEIAVELAEIRKDDLLLLDIKLDASIRNGELNLRDLSVSDKSDGRYKVSGNLIPYDVNGIDYALRAEGSQLSMTFRANTEEELENLPQFELKADLTGRGDDLREIVGSTDGYIRAISGPGLLPTGAFAMFSNDLLTELISIVNPFTKDDGYSKVSCSTIAMNFDDGMVQGNPFLAHQTDKILILANSSINLKTEELNADFKVVPQKGLGLSFSSLLNPYVKVIGTLGEPSIVINPEGVLIQGGVAVATGGISILALSFKDRFLSAPDPCGTAYQNSVEVQE